MRSQQLGRSQKPNSNPISKRGILALALLGIAIPATLLPLSVHNQTVYAQGSLSEMPELSDPNLNLLTVSGQGLVTVETSIAVVRLAVLVDGESAEAVQKDVAERTNSLVERLQQEEVDKLQTTGISLNPRYTYRNNEAEQVGVQGQNAVQFEVPIERAGLVLDGAIEAGATQIQSVSFRASDEVIQSARQEAIRLAIGDAQDQADVALGALSLSQSGIASIQINGSNQAPAPVSLQAAEAYSLSSRSADPTPVLGGEQVVTASVTLRIRY
jgi:uncharacterized protein YggE